jgi:hypothetical protein
MATLKRSLSALQSAVIVIDSDSEEVKVARPHKKDIFPKDFEEFLSPYDAIPEVPTIKLTVAQMNGDPLELFADLERLYSEFGAIKLTASEAWNAPFNFGFVDRPATVRKQVIQDLQEGKVSRPSRPFPLEGLPFLPRAYAGLRATRPVHPHLRV